MHAYLHTQVLPAVDPGFEHWGVRRESSLKPAQEGARVRPRRQQEEPELPPPTYRPTYSSQRGTRIPEEATHRADGRGSARCPQHPWQGAWGRGTHLPAVVHGHEIADQQEGVGQHAHRNLQGDPRVSDPTHRHPGPGFRGQGHPVPAAFTEACLQPPELASQPSPRPPAPWKGPWGPTYPHHKLGVAPDGQRLAELERHKGRRVCLWSSGSRLLRHAGPILTACSVAPFTLPSTLASRPASPQLLTRPPHTQRPLSGPARSSCGLRVRAAAIWGAELGYPD